MFDLDPSTNLNGVKTYVPQSQRWYFPNKLVMGKETQATYQEEFKNEFETLFRATEDGQKNSLAGSRSISQIRLTWQSFRNALDLAGLVKLSATSVTAAL